MVSNIFEFRVIYAESIQLLESISLIHLVDLNKTYIVDNPADPAVCPAERGPSAPLLPHSCRQVEFLINTNSQSSSLLSD